jgi:predicted XRE-type DNA-binding protein
MSDAIEETTGSVLYDLDLPDAPVLVLKAALARHIRQILKERKLTQAKAATLTSIPQAEISLLTNYKLQGISVERLLRALTALGVDVQVVLREHEGQAPGTIAVEAS